MALCPHCKAALSTSPPVRYCPRCFLALTWSGATPQPNLPAVNAGATLLWVDLRRERMPGMKDGNFDVGSSVKITQQAGGLGVQLAGGKAFESAVPFLRRRDHCARALFTAVDPAITFEVVVRRDTAGEAATQVALAVSPQRQAARILRITSGATKTIATPLTDWQKDPRMTVGQPVECELRALGPTLEARLYDRVIARVHEPRLGVGWPGVRIEAEANAGRAIWTGFDVREVAP